MSSRPTFSVRGVLFDVDGTLVDTTYLHTVAWWQAIRQSGQDVAMSRIHRAVGMGADRIVGHLLGDDRDADEDDAILASHQALFALDWPRLRAFPDVVQLLRRCHDDGLAVVLSSSAGAKDLSALRTALDAEEYVTAATGADDVDVSKPSPDLVEAGLDHAGLTAGEAVFVGDAVWDVEAANRIGMPCIGLTCGGTSAAELQEAGAADVYSDPSELLAHYPFRPA